MTFLSPVFIFIFLPLALSVYALMPKYRKPDLLPVMGSLFYVSVNIRNKYSLIYFILMCALAMISISLYKKYKNKRILAGCESIAFIVIVVMLSTKLIGSNNFIGQAGMIVCCMAIISLCSDIISNKGRIPETPWDAITYITFFPIMLAGPLVKYGDFTSKLDNLEFNLNNFSKGALISLKGSIKCIAISAVIFQATEEIVSSSGNNLSAFVAIIISLTNSIGIYSFLSGYSDIARGISLMLGIEISKDFENPFTNLSPSDYIRNFFKSLTTFMKNYISRPIMSKIGVNKFGKTVACLVCGVFLTMLFCGNIDAMLILFPFSYFAMYFVLFRGDEQKKKNILVKIVLCILTFICMAFVWKIINLSTFENMRKFFELIFSNNFFYISKHTKFAMSNLKYFVVPVFAGLLGIFANRVEKYFDVEVKDETNLMTVSKYVCSLLLVGAFLWSIIFILPQFPILASSAFGFWFV